MSRLGNPVPKIAHKEIIINSGIKWEPSQETLDALKAIEDNIKLAAFNSSNFIIGGDLR